MFEFQGITARHHLKRTSENENAGSNAMAGKPVLGSARKTAFGDVKNKLAFSQLATPSNKPAGAAVKSVFKSLATPKSSSSQQFSGALKSRHQQQQPDHRYVKDESEVVLQPVDFRKCWTEQIMPSDADLNRLLFPTTFLEDEHMSAPILPPVTLQTMDESPMPDWGDVQLPPIEDIHNLDTDNDGNAAATGGSSKIDIYF